MSTLALAESRIRYEVRGESVSLLPSGADAVAECKPVYETLPGWRQEISHLRRWQDLPPKACRYVERLCELVGRPVSIVSIGPDREQTIFC